MPPSDEIAQFISASFRSIWSLELLLLLRREPEYHDRGDLVAKLRASDLVVRQAVEGLIAGGLAVADEEGRVAYLPVSANLAEAVELAAEYYARKPDAVRRLIVRTSAPGLIAFSDAFLLRKDQT